MQVHQLEELTQNARKTKKKTKLAGITTVVPDCQLLESIVQ